MLRRAVTVALALGALATAGGASAAFPGESGEIIYASRGDIYLVGADGSGARQLTSTSENDGAPDVTADGRRVVFQRCEAGVEETCDLYVLTLSTGSLRQVTTAGNARMPAWSPDGTRIAYAQRAAAQSTLTAWQDEIAVIDADGGGFRRLTSSPERSDGSPSWSPDGGRIAWHSAVVSGTTSIGCGGGLLNSSDVLVMDADGGNQHEIAGGGTCDSQPDWSPDGREIVFMQSTTQAMPSTAGRIAIVSAEGGAPRFLTSPEQYKPGGPVWSPDGSQIAFPAYSYWYGTPEGLFVVPAAGGTPAQVHGENVQGIAWSVPVPLTKGEAVARVRSILDANAKRCKLKVLSVKAKATASGFRVTATVSASGKKQRAIWVTAGKAVRAKNTLARKIAGGCA